MIRTAVKTLLSAVALIACATAAAAQIPPKSQAESWGLTGEEPRVMTGKIVDVLCEIAGDCAPDCGKGARQMGLLLADGKLVYISKNGQPAFSGAIAELLPFCQKAVDVDGLMVGEGQTRVFQLQFIRAAGSANWTPAQSWTKLWAERNPAIAGKADEWYHNDPNVKKQIDAHGYLGLGAEVDKAFIKKNY